ncbi:MAG: hypothetical protein WB919_13875 [Candidatus Sulfotelmatobacter sp.]
MTEVREQNNWTMVSIQHSPWQEAQGRGNLHSLSPHLRPSACQFEDGRLKFVQELSGSEMVDFAVQKALHDLRQGLLYGVWIIQRYRFEPALAGTLGNSLGAALLLAVMKSAEAQSAAGWALAAGAIFMPVLAFGCIDDGHRVFLRGLFYARLFYVTQGWALPPSPYFLQIIQDQ